MYIYYIAILRFVTHIWVSNLKILIDPFLFNSFVVLGEGGERYYMMHTYMHITFYIFLKLICDLYKCWSFSLNKMSIFT